MLPRTFRLVAKNMTAQTQTYDSGARIRCTYRKWKRNSSGEVVWSDEVVEDFGFGAADTIATTGWDAGSTIDNSTDLYEGLQIVADVTTNHASSAGPFEFYLDMSTDGGTEWASDDVADPDTGVQMAVALPLVAQTPTLTAAITESAWFDYE